MIIPPFCLSAFSPSAQCLQNLKSGARVLPANQHAFYVAARHSVTHSCWIGMKWQEEGVATLRCGGIALHWWKSTLPAGKRGSPAAQIAAVQTTQQLKTAHCSRHGTSTNRFNADRQKGQTLPGADHARPRQAGSGARRTLLPHPPREPHANHRGLCSQCSSHAH